MPEHAPVVVLGFGVASASALVALRASGYTGRIVVLTDGCAKAYSPVLTSYYAGGRIEREQCYAFAEAAPETLADEVCEHVQLTSVDVEGHAVVLADGQRVEYSKLLIATGAHPVAPGFSEFGAYQPLYLRTMADAERLRGVLSAQGCRRVLVSGTSMVGLKVAEACLDRGIGVTLLGRSAHILRSSAHPLVASRFEQLLEQRGVEMRLGQTLIGAQSPTGETGCTVAFSTGEHERFDAVVLAQGTAPNIGFLDKDVLEVDRGIVVDEFMRTSDADVFAAGDCAQGLDLASGEKRVIGLWQNAVQQGRCAGRAIAAELSGRSSTRPYAGSIANNVIHVGDILFASAGRIDVRQGERLEVHETNESMSVFVYGPIAGHERLVGFNTLSAGEAAAEDEIGKHKREVLNTYLNL